MTSVRCQQAGLSVRVLEAAERIGGRVHSVYSESTGNLKQSSYLADLGPTWVWPPYQAAVQSVLEDHKLQLIEQYNKGAAVIERPNESSQLHQLPGQHGMSRLQGGPQSIVNSLAAELHDDTILLNSEVNSVSDKTDYIEVKDKQHTIHARTVVVAAPLRVTSERITFTPNLSDNHQQLMASAATWMATQAKAVLIYKKAFWRDNNLSGRVASQIGPLTEVHDHSGVDGNPAALFGFIGVTAKARSEHSEQLQQAIVKQMVRCFGDQAADPESVIIEDWATNSYICTQRDLDEIPQHPGVLAELIRENCWDGRLLFASAETAVISPGLIDGALEAGNRAAEALISSINTS